MLLYFILGILFISIGIPLIENLMSIVSAFVEYVVYVYAFKIYKIKKQMNEKGQEKQTKYPMGFQTSVVGYELEEDDDDPFQEQEDE